MSANAPQIDILYKLFIDNDGKYDPIETATQRELETALRAADPYKRIGAVADLAEQAQLLQQHIEATFYDFAHQGFSVALDSGMDSRWDPVTRTWIRIPLGASRVYEIRSADNTQKLRLNAWTRGTGIPELEAVAVG